MYTMLPQLLAYMTLSLLLMAASSHLSSPMLPQLISHTSSLMGARVSPRLSPFSTCLFGYCCLPEGLTVNSHLLANNLGNNSCVHLSRHGATQTLLELWVPRYVWPASRTRRHRPFAFSHCQCGCCHLLRVGLVTIANFAAPLSRGGYRCIILDLQHFECERLRDITHKRQGK